MDANIAARLSNEFRSIIDEYDLGQFCTSIGVDTVSPLSKRSLGQGSPHNEGQLQAKVHRCASDDQEGIHVEPEKPSKTKPVVKAVEKSTASKQKGLRHFSLIVCEKLRQLRSTTYHSVSDELVAELTQVNGPAFVGANGKKYEAKNIRRRVYDALNVLLAIGVIRKDKKQITWVGLSSAEPLLDRQRQISERNTALQNVESKRQRLALLMRHYIAHHNISERNRIAHRTGRPVEERLYFPFALIQAPRDAIVEAEMKDERRKIRIIGNKPFTLREDKQLLMKMGCARISSVDLARLIPKDIVPFYSPNHILQHVVFGAPVSLSTDPALYEDIN